MNNYSEFSQNKLIFNYYKVAMPVNKSAFIPLPCHRRLPDESHAALSSMEDILENWIAARRNISFDVQQDIQQMKQLFNAPIQIRRDA